MKKWVVIFFICSLFALPKGQAKLSAFVGVKTNYSGLGALRIGWDQWELGQFAPNAFGINKRFVFKNRYYAALGLGVIGPVELAILSGVGFNIFDFLGFGLRGELYALSGTQGILKGAGTLGASWNF